MRSAFRCLAFLSLTFVLTGQAGDPRAEINALAADPETKFQVLDLIGSDLGTHRNRLVLLKKETGLSFADIYSEELRKRGLTETGIVRRLQMVARRAAKNVGRASVFGAARPIAYLGSSMDYNSIGTVVTLNPEIGLDLRSFGFVAGLPVYRVSSPQRNTTGIGDAYVSAFLRRPARLYEVASGFTLSVPTGSKEQGLGAGRVSVDVNGTVRRHFETLHPFVGVGYTNSTFNNVGYQRPFISNGNAFYTSAGFDYRIGRRLTAGIGGFGLVAIGTQTLISQMSNMQSMDDPGSGIGGGPGMSNGMHDGLPAHPEMGAGTPVSHYVPIRTVAARDASDYGASGWTSWSLHTDVTLSLRFAYSAPNRLTTVRLGVGFDLSHAVGRLRK
jgi:hypothetical protein